MTTQKFKVGDKVKVARKCEFQEPEDISWVDLMDKYIGQEGVVRTIDSIYGINVKFENGKDWWFPTQSLELVTDEETQKEPEKMKQQYVVLVWSKEEGFCGDLVVFHNYPQKTFIGTKKEAKDYRDYMRSNHPEAKYKIAKYPFIIEGHNIPKTVEVQPKQHKKLVKKWRWYFVNLENDYDDGVSAMHFSTAEEFNNHHTGHRAIKKIDSTMIEVEEN